jgi:hypothetical protein
MKDILCPSCGRTLQIRPELAESQIRCPNVDCGALIDLDVKPASPPQNADPENASFTGAATDAGRPGLQPGLPLVLSAVALLVSLLALGLVLVRGGPGSSAGRDDSAALPGAGLGSYDFSTPAAAHRSRVEIDLNQDMRALRELTLKLGSKNLKEILSTLEVRKEVDFHGKKILFLSYKLAGGARREVALMDRDGGTGFWFRMDLYLPALEQENPELAQQIHRWLAEGKLDTGKE